MPKIGDRVLLPLPFKGRFAEGDPIATVSEIVHVDSPNPRNRLFVRLEELPEIQINWECLVLCQEKKLRAVC